MIFKKGKQFEQELELLNVQARTRIDSIKLVNESTNETSRLNM